MFFLSPLSLEHNIGYGEMSHKKMGTLNWILCCRNKICNWGRHIKILHEAGSLNQNPLPIEGILWGHQLVPKSWQGDLRVRKVWLYLTTKFNIFLFIYVLPWGFLSFFHSLYSTFSADSTSVCLTAAWLPGPGHPLYFLPHSVPVNLLSPPIYSLSTSPTCHSAA